MPIPMKRGRPARVDYEYERNGTANLFMLFAPLEGWRHVEATDRHTAIDYPGEAPGRRPVSWLSGLAHYVAGNSARDRFEGQRPMAKTTTIKVKLVSSADTGYFYVTKKNTRTQTEKLVKKKYDPVAKKHVEFREGKIK
jgi:large subunit ribosomal protein L33